MSGGEGGMGVGWGWGAAHGERQDAVSLVCMYPAYAVFELSMNNHLLSV